MKNPEEAKQTIMMVILLGGVYGTFYIYTSKRFFLVAAWLMLFFLYLQVNAYNYHMTHPKKEVASTQKVKTKPPETGMKQDTSGPVEKL